MFTAVKFERKGASGDDLTINVEYNQLDPLLKDSSGCKSLDALFLVTSALSHIIPHAGLTTACCVKLKLTDSMRRPEVVVFVPSPVCIGHSGWRGCGRRERLLPLPWQHQCPGTSLQFVAVYAADVRLKKHLVFRLEAKGLCQKGPSVLTHVVSTIGMTSSLRPPSPKNHRANRRGFGLMKMNRIELISLGLFPSLEPALPRCFKVFHVGTMAQRLATTGGIVPVTWPHSFPSPRSLAMGGC